MNKLTKTLGIAGIVLGLSAGCVENSGNYKSEKSRYKTLIANPVSVGDGIGNGAGVVTFTVGLGDEKIVCQSRHGVGWSKYPLINAILKAELNDGDNEPIKCTGEYARDADGNNIFVIDQLFVENYHFRF